ncbi:MAG TPA: histidine phosphatase family protein [Chloroflexia bacterium]|nr:histidine phosphatase family protein [Chloroflexia bacterium]
MLIILLRHAERETRTDRTEARQVLTPKGVLTADRLGRKLAEKLAEENLSVTRLLSSAYVRATESAGLIVAHLGLPLAAIQVLGVLQMEPEGSVEESFEPVLEAASNGVVVVGHGPELAELCFRLCGQRIELKKACALALEWDVTRKEGRLLWKISHKPDE